MTLTEATATATIAHRRRGIWLVYYADDQADAEVWDAFGSLRAAKAWVEDGEGGQVLVWKWTEHAPGAWMGTAYVAEPVECDHADRGLTCGPECESVPAGDSNSPHPSSD